MGKMKRDAIFSTVHFELNPVSLEIKRNCEVRYREAIEQERIQIKMDNINGKIIGIKPDISTKY